MRKLKKLVSWLEGQRYGYYKNGLWINFGDEEDSTEEFERENLYQISRNRMINKTIRYIKDEL